MPNKSLRSCAYPGCTDLVRSGYCDKHKTNKHSHYDTNIRDRESKAFYNSSQWQKCRLAILARDNYLCQVCLDKKILTAATTVHHKMKLKLNRSLAFDESNLVSVCDACHNAVEGRL